MMSLYELAIVNVFAGDVDLQQAILPQRLRQVLRNLEGEDLPTDSIADWGRSGQCNKLSGICNKQKMKICRRKPQ